MLPARNEFDPVKSIKHGLNDVIALFGKQSTLSATSTKSGDGDGTFHITSAEEDEHFYLTEDISPYRMFWSLQQKFFKRCVSQLAQVCVVGSP
jgi:hypothetical protein